MRSTLAQIVTDAPKPDKPVKEKLPAASPPPIQFTTGDLDKNLYFRILGNVNDAVAVMLRTQRPLLFSRSSLTQASTLLSIAPNRDWWIALTGRDSFGSAVCQHVGAAIIARADDLGQIDPASFIGRGYYRTKDRQTIVCHLGNRLMVGGREIGLGELEGVTAIAAPKVRLYPEAATSQERGRLAAALLECRWASPADGKRFLGWLVASVVGGALNWRVHSWMSASSGSGKSWIIDYVAAPILGDFCVYSKDTSPAGLARVTRSDSMPVIFDEAEPKKSQVEGVLDILRMSTGGGGTRIRADRNSTSGYDTFQPRFSAMLSSVKIAYLNNEANRSRFAIIGLAVKTPETEAKWPQVEKEVTDALGHPGRFLTAMIQDGEKIVAGIEAQTKTLVQSGIGGRKAAIEAALSVGWSWWSGETEHVGLDVAEYDTASDSVTLVQDLLGLRLRTFDRGDQSVAKILRAGDPAGLALDYGFRIADGALEIAPNHASLAALLSRSQWAGVDLRRTLTQIDGVTTRIHAVHFAGVKARSVVIPAEVLEKVGIDLSRQFDERQNQEDPQLEYEPGMRG